MMAAPTALKSLFPVKPSNKFDLAREMKKELFCSVRDRIMKDMVEMMTGKKIILLDPSSAQDESAAQDGLNSNGADSQDAHATSQGAAPKPQGWGVDYYYKETQTTKEGVAVSVAGTVTTADGKTLDFTASLEMTRETYDETSVSVKAGDALIDPLMIDTTGQGVRLSGATFNFDLNADGVAETIHAPATGTGFLAYDKNGNGIIDNGSELFGPLTGKGFSELSQFDTDKNGWIDENDSIFDRLSVWQKGPDGTDSLASRRDSGIGAIYLGRTASRFDLTDTNSPQGASVAGVVRDTGIFLKENGQTGFIQEVDLAA
jgi:hypothetical protein